MGDNPGRDAFAKNAAGFIGRTAYRACGWTICS
jgi:hypothetical protein